MAAGKPQSPPANTGFIKDRFRRYYSEVGIAPPSSLESREFGVITERAGMWRHLGFKGQKELRDFLAKQVPLHAYHSSAYYTTPNARTMEEKKWLGADLIFDLDADHIRNTENMTMEEMFAAVKVQFRKLVHDYLLGDFGFDEKDVRIVFSGGRGYHAHVCHEKVLGLSSHERREMVDYITLPDPDVDRFLIVQPLFSKKFLEHIKVEETFRLYPEGTPGWKGRTTRGVLDFIRETEGMPRDAVVTMMRDKGITRQMAEKVFDDIYMGSLGNRGIDKIKADYNLDIFSSNGVRNKFIEGVLKEIALGHSGETDEPVTSDVKRLIRLPGSLHGKTGLVAKSLSINELDDFLPLRDAFWDGFDDIAIKVTGIQDHAVTLRNNDFKVKKGAETELPEYAALFFTCRKLCNIIL